MSKQVMRALLLAGGLCAGCGDGTGSIDGSLWSPSTNALGECGTVSAPAGLGAKCDDGNACTFADQCDGAGACVGSSPTCPPNTTCRTYAPACDGTSACTATAINNGAFCTTARDNCDGGRCDAAGNCVAQSFCPNGSCDADVGETCVNCAQDCCCPSCTGKICGADNGCGSPCVKGSGCCRPMCAFVPCGADDLCGHTCTPGSGCLYCGDGACNNGETCGTCPGDCGSTCPKVWFKFDEVSGTPFNSGSLGSLGQTLVGGPIQNQPGKNGSAIKFTSYTQYLQIPDNDALDGYSNLTLEGWVNLTTALPTGKYAHMGKKNLSYLCRLYNLNGTVNIENVMWNNGSTYTKQQFAITAPTVGTWYHLACTWNGATKTQKIYWNGVWKATKTVTTGGAPLVNSTSVLTVPDNLGSGENLYGLVDDFKLWNLTRTDAEICASAGRVWNGTACN